jgi:SAM-dependent methyltransferase
MTADVLPANFDAALYRARYKDVRALGDAELARHFHTTGIGEGRAGSAVATRPAFVDLIRGAGSILEIGPFANPMLSGPNVKYFDVLSTEDLKQRARKHNLNPKGCPRIDYVSSTGDLSIVTEQFDAVASSHVIEHQPDLIRHLLSVANLLKTGGNYFLAIPDKRFCFDHFIAPSTIADVLDAHSRKLRVHSIASIVEHRALTTHNDARRHWNNDHGEPAHKASLAPIQEALAVCLGNPEGYIDTHAWQFTPGSFEEIVATLFALRMSPLQVARVYDTVRDSCEFYAVLEKTDSSDFSEPELPAGFDPAQYLLANPDVARAGVDAARHYLSYGYREGRKLRP